MLNWSSVSLRVRNQSCYTRQQWINTIHKAHSFPLERLPALISLPMLHANSMNNWFHSNRGNLFLMHAIMAALDIPLQALRVYRGRSSPRRSPNKEQLFSLTRQSRYSIEITLPLIYRWHARTFALQRWTVVLVYRLCSKSIFCYLQMKALLHDKCFYTKWCTNSLFCIKCIVLYSFLTLFQSLARDEYQPVKSFQHLDYAVNN